MQHCARWVGLTQLSIVMRVRATPVLPCGNSAERDETKERGKSDPMALAWKESEYICADCGGPVADALRRLGSLACHDCRGSSGLLMVHDEGANQRRPRRRRYLFAALMRRR
jgi:DNA-directed RNA polymerase subunit RPC12/RpoP